MTSLRLVLLLTIAALPCVAIFASWQENSPFVKAQPPQSETLDREIDALIKVFAHPEAAGNNLGETSRAIKELTAIGKPAEVLPI
jgi:hypothetical protein